MSTNLLTAVLAHPVSDEAYASIKYALTPVAAALDAELVVTNPGLDVKLQGGPEPLLIAMNTLIEEVRGLRETLVHLTGNGHAMRTIETTKSY